MKRLKACLLVFCVLYTGFSGISFALPIGLADSGQAVTILLDQHWAGMAKGTYNGKNVNWYTGYGFYYEVGEVSGPVTQGDSNHVSYAFCVDPAAAALTDMYPFYIESLETFSGSPFYTQYLEAAWLLNYGMNNGQIRETQIAAWEIMLDNPGVSFVYTGSNPSAVSALVNLAEQNYADLNPDGFYLALSPTRYPATSFNEGFQDYLFYQTPELFPNPEPSSLILLGSGLMITSISVRRKVFLTKAQA